MDSTNAAPAAQDSQPAEIEVTLRSPDFDEFAFRASEHDLPSVIASQVSAAHATTLKRKQLAAIDQAQANLQRDIADVDRRIQAATLLKDDARVERESEAKAALQDKIAGLAAQRAALAD